jgi:hypothetical protein
MGKNLVFHWNSRYYNINNNVGYDKVPGNPITGRGGPINEIGIAIQIFQIAYIVLTVIIIGKETTTRRRQTIKER